MAKVENNLKNVIAEFGTITSGELGRVDHGSLRKCGLHDDVQEVYKSLNGSLEVFPVNSRNTWDIEFDGIAIEIDEYLHFNRCRLVTLDSRLYQELPKFGWREYKEYCLKYEERCLKAGGYGGKWTNKSAERQFDNSPPPGQLIDAGPARWRQRAFYDFLKDIVPLVLRFPVVRLAIWDSIEIDGEPCTLERALRNPTEKTGEAIYKLVQQRRNYP